MVLLALDDTDSVCGGCTTHLGWELVHALPGVDLVGLPRLVRLNPNVPWKTRGNGAVVLPLGHGRGLRLLAGASGSEPVWAYGSGEPLSPAEEERVWHTAVAIVESRARLEDPKTNPGLALLHEPPPEALYWDAVRHILDANSAPPLLAACGARWRGWKNGRGLLGAAAAAAWPARSGTYEWVAYRDATHWGTRRALDPRIGPELDRRFPSTFDNYDARRSHLRLAPASPCPVLAGIRGTDPGDLAAASQILGPEAPLGGLLFATNQATDDHLAPAAVRDLAPFQGAVVRGVVQSPPRVTPGGHVFVRVSDGTASTTLAAFEPTKEFRHPVRRLRPGDAVEASGSTHADTRTLALEKIRILDTAPRLRRRPPRCDACGSRMKSRGRTAGFRCRRCRTRARPEAAVGEVSGEAPERGAHEVPVLVRRHLSRPLRFSTPPALGFR